MRHMWEIVPTRLLIATKPGPLKKPPPKRGRRRLTSTITNRSSRFAERALHAGLQGLNRVRRHFLRQARELLRLFGEDFKLLARMRGRQFKELGRRFHTNQLPGKVKGGIGVGADHLNPL